MNPVKFMNDLIDVYNTKKSMMTSNDCDKPLFSIDDMINTLERVKKITAENTEYEIAVKSINGQIITNKLPFACKQSVIEDMYVIQPTLPISNDEYMRLNEILEDIQRQGAFEGKCILILPHDVQALRAIVDYSTIDADDKWARYAQEFVEKITQGLGMPKEYLSSSNITPQGLNLTSMMPSGRVQLKPDTMKFDIPLPFVQRDGYFKTIQDPNENITMEFDPEEPSGVKVFKDGVQLSPDEFYVDANGVVTLKQGV